MGWERGASPQRPRRPPHPRRQGFRPSWQPDFTSLRDPSLVVRPTPATRLRSQGPAFLPLARGHLRSYLPPSETRLFPLGASGPRGPPDLPPPYLLSFLPAICPLPPRRDWTRARRGRAPRARPRPRAEVLARAAAEGGGTRLRRRRSGPWARPTRPSLPPACSPAPDRPGGLWRGAASGGGPSGGS